MGKRVDTNVTAKAVVAQAKASAPAPTLESLAAVVAAQGGQIVAQDAKLDAILAALKGGRTKSKSAKAAVVAPKAESPVEAALRPHRNILTNPTTGKPQLGNLSHDIVIADAGGGRVRLRDGRGSIYGARLLVEKAGAGATVEPFDGQAVTATYRWNKAAGKLDAVQIVSGLAIK